MNVMKTLRSLQQLCSFKSLRSALFSMTSPQSLFNASSGNDIPEALRGPACHTLTTIMGFSYSNLPETQIPKH